MGIAGDWTRGRIVIGNGAMLWVKKSQNKKHHEKSTLVNMLFSCSCTRKLSCFCYEGKPRQKVRSSKVRRSFLALAGSRLWREHTGSGRTNTRTYTKIAEHIQENRRNRRIKHRNTNRTQWGEIGTASPPSGQQVGCRSLLN